MNIVQRIVNKLNREYRDRLLYPNKVKGKQKIFCIGRNKTGTTSLEKAFVDLGFVLGNQGKADKFLESYINGDFKPIVKFCKSAQVFQDFPFSFPDTFKHLDRAYPKSKFILTIRDSPEQWYNSLVKFHSKIYGGGNIPTIYDLKNAKQHRDREKPWKKNQAIYDAPENDPYNKEILIQSYNEYNQSVLDYFKDRHNDLIVINIAEKGSYKKLMNFLNINSPHIDFPWENKTEKIAVK